MASIYVEEYNYYIDFQCYNYFKPSNVNDIAIYV